MRERDKQMLADHYLDFYQMAYTILHEEADVEDAVQDALTDTMSQPFVRDPYGYCCRVLKNKCYKKKRTIDIMGKVGIPDEIVFLCSNVKCFQSFIFHSSL